LDNIFQNQQKLWGVNMQSTKQLMEHTKQSHSVAVF